MIPVIIFIGLIATGMIIAGLWFPEHQRCVVCRRWTRITFSFCPYCGQAFSPSEQAPEPPRIENRQGKIQVVARQHQRLRSSGKTIIVSEDEAVKSPRLVLSSGETKYDALVRSLCPACWRKINEGDRFCGHCGSEVRRASRK